MSARLNGRAALPCSAIFPMSKLRRRGFRLSIWSLTFVATHVSAVLAQGNLPSPWTDERANALVYIEAPVANQSPSVATGFIVNGRGGKQYVATSTHGLLPEANEEEVKALQGKPDECISLPEHTTLRPGARGTSPLRVGCGAYHIGKDVSLVEFSRGTSPLPALSFRACDLKVGDEIYLGGFPLGGDRLTMIPGKVSGNGPQGLLAQSVTAPGLSGGPYLTADGDVVAIHRGAAEYAPAYAYIVPITDIRTKLDALLPGMTEKDCPKPATYQNLVQSQIAAYEKAFADKLYAHLGIKLDEAPKATFDQRIQFVEAIINELRSEVQWGIFTGERAGIPVATIWYKRMVVGPSPADRLELTVKAVTNPPDPNLKTKVYIYPDEEIKEVEGKSGKYEKGIRSELTELAENKQMPINQIELELRSTSGTTLLASSSFSLSKSIEPTPLPVFKP